MSSHFNQLQSELDKAFASGNNEGALQLLRELVQVAPDNAELHYRLGVVEEQIGTSQGALRAYSRCVTLAPQNPLALLYAGYCHEQAGLSEQAAVLYALAVDVNPQVLRLWQNNSQSRQTQIRSHAANLHYRKTLSELHKQSVGDDPAVARIRQAIWPRSHDVNFQFADSQQVPQLFYIPGLPAQAVFDAGEWDWAKQLVAATQEIQQELLQALGTIRDKGRPYLSASAAGGGEFEKLAGSLNWTALDLFKEGKKISAIAEHFPRTLELLLAAPLYGIQEYPFEVFFSVLKAGQDIPPHYGQSNHSLTVHLPLLVPENCYLQVAGEKHYWCEGELLVFDDTFLHDALNGSTSERIVLLFSIWHPDLSAAERTAIQRSFTSRQHWLDQRQLPS